MKLNFSHWIVRNSTRIFNSIAFYPAIIVLGFLLLAGFMIYFDYTETGKSIKSDLEFLKLRDAETARSIISVIAGGLISLTVFSFSMVMIVLNQAASQMSNRVLDKLIGNRYQQFILGYYIGTIVYALILLTAIRDIDEGLSIPALSAYLLIILSVVAIFLFIYFLHYITQSIKYAVIIKRIFRQTKESLHKTCRLTSQTEIESPKEGRIITAFISGIFEGFHKKELLELAVKNNMVISFIHPFGNYVIKGAPVAHIKTARETDADLDKELELIIILKPEEEIEKNYYYGFRQLVEVAIKALSPGINDPGTAIESLRSIFSLLAYRLNHYPDNVVKDKNGNPRIITNEKSFSKIFTESLYPIWSYGSDDRLVQLEMLHLLKQLKTIGSHPEIDKLTAIVKKQISAFEEKLNR